MTCRGWNSGWPLESERNAVICVSQKATMRTILKVTGLCLLLAASRPVLAQSSPRAPIVVISPTTIGKSETGYRNPALGVASDGTVTVIAEAGATNDRRLAVADLSAIGWTETTLLDFTGPGDCCNPSLAYDSSGTLHLAWSEKMGSTDILPTIPGSTGILPVNGDAYAIRYARRTAAGQWHDEGVISVTPQLDCEFPQLAGDQSGRLWVVWQAGRATRFGIYLAWWDGDTSLTVLDVTGEQGDHHNLYPQLFPDSPYPLVWYEEAGTDFELRSAVPTVSGTGFEVIAPLEFERLDTNQMPWLFQAPSGMLGGVWTDLIGERVRVLVGFQSPSSWGEGFVADLTVTGDAAQPCAMSLGEETVALAWTSRQAAGSALLVGGVEGSSRVGPSVVLALSPDGYLGQPRLAAGGGKLVHCVWFSDAARGGNGDLYYAALRF